MRRWHLLTGEFPPDRGGVADWCATVARALVAAGGEVSVWCPPAAPGARRDGGDFDVREVEGLTGFGGGRALARRARGELERGTWLVAYTPGAFGARSVNLGLCATLLAAARAGADVRVVFHEPFFPFGERPMRRNALAAAHRAMATLLLHACRIAYVSTPSWIPLLAPWALAHDVALRWLPVPAGIPTAHDPDAVAAVRAALAESDVPVLGHFGTYGAVATALLDRHLPRILDAAPSVAVHLLGRGGGAYARSLAARMPRHALRITAADDLDARALSLRLQACDVMLQPYPDGVTTRRTTAMAALAHGVALATTDGRYTEPLWRAHDVTLAPASSGEALAEATLALLADADRRRAAGAAGRALYDAAFDVPHVVAELHRPQGAR